LDLLYYKDSVITIINCIILKFRLQYLINLVCIVKLTLNWNNCKIETYNNIYKKISDIKQRNAVAKYINIR
jgi:hypothetical protein